MVRLRCFECGHLWNCLSQQFFDAGRLVVPCPKCKCDVLKKQVISDVPEVSEGWSL